MWAGAALLAIAAVVAPGGGRATERLVAFTGTGSGDPRPGTEREVLRIGVFGVVAGTTAALVIRGLPGLAVGVAVGVAVVVVLRRAGRRSESADPLALAAVLDLLAACLRSGLPLATATGAVADCAPGELGGALRRTSDLLQLGGDPGSVWDELESDPATEPLARLARRSARSGIALADGVEQLAARLRDEAQVRASAAAERAGVAVSGPLGLCFLPAFVCLGIVPVVVGLAGRVLGNGLW
ncbi:type II secretion system F family protein [Rhodococcus sp. D2-41]|uniref:Type II secretion system F family protein n=1 Tax=Speluncibacter jeojiensis TaxID=2710754 RepID=A0A9X4M852_9ACTN|nr:type II secretion system F family protein [Rhodococcus sp. D2-41]MDG3017073.1 type II secretion system F family protein [Corynebacteriales bacterium D3-21]